MNCLENRLQRNTVRLASLGLWAIVALSPLYAAHCNDPELTFTIHDTYTDPGSPSGSQPTQSGIVSDGLGVYSTGNGVNAVINTCNGSNGATLSPGSNRLVTVDLGQVVFTNIIYNPGWASSPVLFLTIPNILFSCDPDPTKSCVFDTYLKVTLKATKTATTLSGYFDMQNPLANAPFNSPDATLNTPCITSLVHIQHNPAVAGGTRENWIVWPDSNPANSSCGGAVSGTPVQVGTLSVPSSSHKGGQSTVNAGQYAVPFYITITRN